MARILNDCVKSSEGCLVVEKGALGGFISYLPDNPNAPFNLAEKRACHLRTQLQSREICYKIINNTAVSLPHLSALA